MNIGERILFVSTEIAVACCSCLLPLAARRRSKPPEVKSVRTITVDPKPLDDDRRAIGEVKPRYESELAFLCPARWSQRMVDVGATVRKGDVLARFDDQDYRNRLKQRRSRPRRRAGRPGRSTGRPKSRIGSFSPSGSTTRALYDAR